MSSRANEQIPGTTSGLVITVEHNGDKRTEVFIRERLVIGHDPTSDVRLPADTSPPFIELELARRENQYEVVRVAPASLLTHHDEPLLPGAIISDADEVYSPEADLRLRFFPVGLADAIPSGQTGELELRPRGRIDDSRTPHVAPFIEHAAIEAAATSRRDDAKVFLREFTRELVREISPITKIITLLVVTLLLSGVFYFVYETYASRKEVQRSRVETQALQHELTRLREQMGLTSQEIKQIGASNENIVNMFSIAPTIAAKYSGGVCLIAGTYQWFETGTNRPLRNEQNVDEDGVPLPAESEGEGAGLTPDGDGTIAQFDFVGTGFHVGDGYVVTNRHVAARPWEADPRAQYLTGTVPARARVVSLVAFFPHRRQPVALRLRSSSQNEDLAICTFDKTEIGDIPVLPLDDGTGASDTGRDVVMMGYPSGPDRLLALLPETQSRQAQARYGGSLEGLIGYLASQNLIRPLTTRGTITDLPARRIVFDAQTAEGGSGAPLFGPSARVIGINFAVLPSNTASNFAVPVRFARELLTRAGWRLRDPAEDATGNGTASNTNSASAQNTPVPATR